MGESAVYYPDGVAVDSAGNLLSNSLLARVRCDSYAESELLRSTCARVGSVKGRIIFN